MSSDLLANTVRTVALPGSKLSARNTLFNTTQYQPSGAVLALPAPAGSKELSLVLKTGGLKDIAKARLAQAKKYDEFVNGATAHCLVLSIFDPDEIAKKKGQFNGNSKKQVTVTMLLLSVSKHAKDRTGVEHSTKYDGMCLPAAAGVWWPATTLVETTSEVYRDAQRVLCWLDLERRAAQKRISTKNERFTDATGKLHADLDKPHEVLVKSAMSEDIKTKYLPNCKIGNVPKYSPNNSPKGNGQATAAAAAKGPANVGYVTDNPTSASEYEQLVVKLLKKESVANLVAYIIHEHAENQRLDKFETVEPLRIFEAKIPRSPLLKPYVEVDVTGIECNFVINPLLVSLDATQHNQPKELKLHPGLKARGFQPANQGTNKATPYQVASMLEIYMRFNLYPEYLPTLDELLEQNQMDLDMVNAQKAKGTSKDVNFHTDLLFVPFGALKNAMMERDKNDPAVSTKSFSAVAFTWDDDVTVDEQNPWVAKAVEEHNGKPALPQMMRAKMAIVGYQWSKSVVVAETDPFTFAATNGMFSQPLENKTEVDYRVYFGELTSIGGELKIYSEALINFGLNPEDIVNWPNLARVIFKYAKGIVNAYIQFTKSRDIATQTMALDLSEPEQTFFNNHLHTNLSDGRSYMLIKQSKLEYALDIACKMAPVTVTYSAGASSLIVDYGWIIQQAGIPVSHKVCTEFLAREGRPLCKTLPSDQLNNGGVIILSSDSAIVMPSEATHDFYLIYPHLESDDQIKAREIMAKITPESSNKLYSQEFLQKAGMEQYDYLKEHGLYDTKCDFVKVTRELETAKAYAFAVPKNHKKVVNNETTRIMDQATKAIAKITDVTAKLDNTDLKDIAESPEMQQQKEREKAAREASRFNDLEEDIAVKKGGAMSTQQLPPPAAALPSVPDETNGDTVAENPKKRKADVITPTPEQTGGKKGTTSASTGKGKITPTSSLKRQKVKGQTASQENDD